MAAVMHSVRAGRSIRRPGSKLVEAMGQRGLLYLTEEDGLTHFCWKDGGSGETVDDLILFPGDASFRSLSQSPRTCALRFSSSDAIHFYWLQDPDPDTDEGHIATINALLQAPDDDEPQAAGDQDVQMQGSSNQASAPAARSSNNQQNQLASLLQAFQNEPDLGGGGGGSAHQVPYTLSDVASSTALAPLLSDPQVRERLYAHLPAGLEHSEATLRSIVHSPETRRSLSSLDQALRTGALGPLVQSLGLRPDAALSVDNFLQAIQHKVDEQENSEMDTS